MSFYLGLIPVADTFAWAQHPTRPTLKLRTGANPDAPFLSTDCHRHEVKVEEVRGEWCKVKYKGVSGWVRSSYLARPSGSSGTSHCGSGGTNLCFTRIARARHPTRPTLKLRTSAHPDAPFLSTDCHCHDVRVEDVRGEWCRVGYNGVSGWIRTAYLSPRPS